MLSSFALLFSLYVSTTVAAATGSKAARPECVQKCWDYTQYVSLQCAGDNDCLCADSEYQNAVYQCLYSQCATPQFANALHHTLAICHKDQPQDNSPALLRQEPGQRRKRDVQMPMASVSNSAGASVTRSAGASVTRSAGASVTRSAGASVTRSAGASVTRSAGASVSRSASVGRPSASVNRSVSASNYNRGGSMRAAPTLSAMMPMYKRSR